MYRQVYSFFEKLLVKITGTSSIYIGSLHNAKDRKKAILLIRQGQAVGVYNRGVCAIWGNGSDMRFQDAVIKIKGEQRNKRPLAATLQTQKLIKFIDKDRIPAKWQNIFLEANELSARLGSLCFVRIPITKEAESILPASMVSITEDGYPIIQNWDAHGHEATHAFVQEMLAAGIDFPAVTSMNTSGEAEIVDQDHGVQFARDHGIPIFLRDHADGGIIKGSYTIFNIDSRGLKLVREGNIPSHLFVHLFEDTFDTNDSKKPNHPQHQFPSSLLDGLNPQDARIAILSYIKQHDKKDE